MRILQISSARHFGGGERHFVDLCRGLHERGHEVYVALRPTNEWEARLSFLPPERFLHVSIRNSFGVFSAKRIAAFVRDNNIDVIHAHVARDYVPASLACVLAKRGTFILTRHVLFALKPFNRFALRNMHKAIAVSSAVESGLRRVFPAEKVVCIPNGIEMADRSTERRKKLREEFRFLHNIPFDVPVIGTIGELLPLKGQQDFVLASQEIARRFPEARFVIVGKDHSLDQKFRRELKRLVRVFDLEHRYLWLDWVDDTSPLLSALDLFVSASHSESFGLAILEAMTAGTTVVATNTEGARELLGDEGLLVPIEEPAKLAERVCILLRDEALRQAFAANLQQHATSTYSLDRMIDRTEEVYVEAVRPAIVGQVAE